MIGSWLLPRCRSASGSRGRNDRNNREKHLERKVGQVDLLVPLQRIHPSAKFSVWCVQVQYMMTSEAGRGSFLEASY